MQSITKRWNRESPPQTAQEWGEFLNGKVEVGLIGWNLGAAGAVALAEALKVNGTVKLLSLRNALIGDAGALAEARTLTKMHLDHFLDDADAAELAEVLQVVGATTERELAFNTIGDAGAVALAEALKDNDTLELLYLNSNQIGDVGAVALAEALKVNGTLTTLGLELNRIGDAGAVALAEALKFNSTLASFFLNRNQISDVRIHEFLSVLKEQPARARRLADTHQRQRTAMFCWSWLRKHADARPWSVSQSGGDAVGLPVSMDIGCLPNPLVRVAAAFILAAGWPYWQASLIPKHATLSVETDT